MKYLVHTLESAPVNARDTLEKIVEAWGFLPHLGAVMAESPAALELLWVAYAALNAKGTLTPPEQQLVRRDKPRERLRLLRRGPFDHGLGSKAAVGGPSRSA